jgi:2-polyprenyl-3-methyl-5-hydroxy-6-metoxy-1,4-benzoquinol methylase
MADELVKPTDGYTAYDEWKHWSKDAFLATSDVDAAYFEGELSGLTLHGANVLEVGFGNGSFLAWARAKGANVFGTEIQPELIARARNAGIRVLDSHLGRHLDQFSNTFDLVVAFDVLEHLSIPEIRDFLRDLETLIRPGGHFLARFPNAASPFSRDYQHSDITHKSCLTTGAISMLIVGSSFHMVRSGNQYIEVVGPLRRRLLRRAQISARNIVSSAIQNIYGFKADLHVNAVVMLQKRSDMRS